MKQRARSIAILLAVTLISYTCAGFACNRQNTLAQAAEAAKDIGGGVRDVIKAVGEAYDAKLISLEQKDQLAEILKTIAKGGQKGVDAIQKLQEQGVDIPTPDQRAILNRIFDDDVVAPFLGLLTRLGTLSNEQSVAIRAALASVRTAIVLLSSRIGRADVIKAIEAGERVYA